MKKKPIIASAIIILLLAACAAIASSTFSGGSISGDPSETEIQTDNKIRAEEILSGMTLEEKVGQMFMGCFYSQTPSAETVNSYHLGGLLLFRPSFDNTPRETLTAQLAAMDGICNVSPITAVDEEGGYVVRVSSSKHYRSEAFKSPQALFAAGGIEAIISDAHEKNKLLKSLGIDMNLAPVCDISTNPDDFMYSRSLAQDAKTTAEFVSAIVRTCHEDGIASCLKHFPGYGSAADTHIGSAIDDRSIEELRTNDMLPFAAGIDAGAPCVMVSHNTVTSIDSSLPASLSAEMHRILREELSFDGIIMTDDLIMGAAANYGSKADVAVAAVAAGNDMLCTGDYDVQIQAIIDAVNNGTITKGRINKSVKKILMMKLNLGIIS